MLCVAFGINQLHQLGEDFLWNTNETLVMLYTGELNIGLYQQGIASVGALVEEKAVGALLEDCGANDEFVTKNGPFLVGNIGFVYHKTNIVLPIECHQIIDTEHVLAGALEIFEIVGMVHHTRMIGILVVDLYGIFVDRHSLYRFGGASQGFNGFDAIG